QQPAHPPHLPPGRQRHDPARGDRARGPCGARVRLPTDGGDAPRSGGAGRRVDPRRTGAHADGEGVGRRQRAPLRHPRRRQAARRARLAAPFRARPRGRVRGHHREERDEQDPQRGGAAAGATAVGMSSRNAVPTDTADAKAAKAKAKKRRSAATAEARAAARRERQRARSRRKSGGGGSSPAPGETGGRDGAADVRASTGLAGLRDRAVELWLRRIHPVLDVVSPIGWALVGVTAACWIAGLTLHVTELNVIAFALTVPLVIAALFVLGKASYKVTLDLQTHRVVAGTRAVGRVEVANPTQRTILPSRIELAVGSATAQFMVPRLAADAAHEELFAVPTKRRAVLVVGPVRSVRDDPLSLMRRQVTWAKEQELFVHPRTVRLDEAASGFLRDLE